MLMLVVFAELVCVGFGVGYTFGWPLGLAAMAATHLLMPYHPRV